MLFVINWSTNYGLTKIQLKMLYYKVFNINIKIIKELFSQQISLVEYKTVLNSFPSEMNKFAFKNLQE